MSTTIGIHNVSSVRVERDYHPVNEFYTIDMVVEHDGVTTTVVLFTGSQQLQIQGTAAPELLAALKRMVACCDNVENCEGGNEAVAQLDVATTEARTVIAKATGSAA